MQLSNLRRNQIASLLGFTLIILTISVAGAGYFTYINLNKIVSRLETDNQPDNNLLLYKEIMVALTGMENQVEFYQLTADNQYLENYNGYTESVSVYLDSINKLNRNDKDLLAFNDSLAILIDRKTDILNTLLQLDPEIKGNDLSGLQRKLDQIPQIVKEDASQSADSLATAKMNTDSSGEPVTINESEPEEEDNRGWLKKLFSSNKKKEDNEKASGGQDVETDTETENTLALQKQLKDSILIAKANRYRAELTDEIQKIKESSEYAAKEMKTRQLELETKHFRIQSRIMDLISYLESRESLKLELNTLHAKEITSKTNQQILTFTILGTLLLLTSLIILLNYFNKSMKYQQLLEEAKRSTETLARTKERFFANMSHEIRTPMNAISGFSKILLKSDLGNDQREQVEIISKSSEHLLKLLNDILDFSKLQAEKLQLEASPFNLDELCRDTLKILKESADRKKLELKYDSQNLPKIVIGDPYRLRQILINILNNGIKYTEKGEVRLSVSAKNLQEETSITIKVSDTGIGIPKSQQSKLFREFQQANQSSFSKGTGLGLAITKKLVLLHKKGKIDLKSAEGKGTDIIINLSYRIGNEKEINNEQPVQSPSLGKLKALIADDEPYNVKLLATLLDRHNITYDEASDGEKAYKLLTKNLYDVVLLDLKMPNKNGWEIVKQVREGNGPNKHKPFIALTATVSKLEEERSEAYGFDHIMRKPFDENRLFELIAKKTNKELAQVNDSTIDLSILHQMGDRKFVSEMVETFISSAEEGMDTMSNNLRDGNFHQMSITAHRIVAPARHFKASKLVSMLKSLEKRAEKKDKTISAYTLNEIKQELTLTFEALRKSLEKEVTK